MSTTWQVWLVARRELRERIHSKGLWAGTALMLLVVVAAIAIPSLADSGPVTMDVGFTGSTPDDLSMVVTEMGRGVDVTVRVHDYGDVDAGMEAVRGEHIDALVVDASRLMWLGTPNERLRAVLRGAIQVVAVQERAAAAGISADQLAELTAPVEVDNVELGITSGRSPDDETAAVIMSVLLIVAIASYGQLVLIGVAQEKSSRVVEVLLARMPARTLLAGKVLGIGLVGFAQFVLTALVALVTALVVDAADIPAIGGDVLAWVVVWFVLGYAFYAMAYGAFGSLASRTEDASSIATPVTTLLIVAYWAAYVPVAGDPEGAWAKLVSYLPPTAPFAMPARIALGTATWWEPFLSAGIAVAAIAALVVFAGRVYTGAILRTGATVRLQDVWRSTPPSSRSDL